LPHEPVVFPIVQQLVKSSTSVGANYRASCRGRSLNEIVSKLSIVEEEADETAFWLEVLVESQLLAKSDVIELHREANEIVAMVVASKRTLKARTGAKGFARSESQIVNRES
jgi:four helix bundle protein